MRIPTGDFGYRSPTVQRNQVNTSGMGADTQALQNVAQTGMAIARDMQQEKVALARVKAGNAVLERELQIRSILDDGEKQLQEGKLTSDSMEEYYKSSIQKLKAPTVEGLDDVAYEQFQSGLKSVDLKGSDTVRSIAGRARINENKATVDMALENFGRLAGQPDADVAIVNNQMNSLDTAGRIAYGEQWPLVKQKRQEANWYNQANQRIMTSKDNLELLRQVEDDLTKKDGFYLDKLDTEPRNILLNNVINNRLQLESRIERDALRAQQQASTLLAKYDQQIASGIPTTPEQQNEFRQKIAGTGYETELDARIKNETEVQNMLRLPIEKQIEFVQEKQAAIKQGATMAEAANVERMSKAVQANVKQLQEDPLLFNQQRTGVPVQPVNMAMLFTPETSAQVKQIFSDRVADIRATQQKYGDRVQMRPLLPQEAKSLSAMLDQQSPEEQGIVFASLRKAFDDDAAYLSAMQQIAPDSPIKARAGSMIAAGGGFTMEDNWFSPDAILMAQDAAKTLLIGESILNKTKIDKSADGKSKSFPMPPESNFRSSFSEKAKKAFAGEPQAFESAMQAVRAYYVGKSAEVGDVSGEIDEARMQEAITAVVGNVVTVGQSDVVAPWGMDAADFEDRLDRALVHKLKSANFTEDQINDRDIFGFQPSKQNGKYYLLEGKSYKLDSDGRPILIDVTGFNQRSFIEKTVDKNINNLNRAMEYAPISFLLKDTTNKNANDKPLESDQVPIR